MAFEETIHSISLAADASLALYTGVPGQPGSAKPNSGFQYRFVKVTGKTQVGLCKAAADRAIGVMQSKPQVVGQAATIALWGVSFVQAGGAVAAGFHVEEHQHGVHVGRNRSGRQGHRCDHQPWRCTDRIEYRRRAHLCPASEQLGR